MTENQEKIKLAPWFAKLSKEEQKKHIAKHFSNEPLQKLSVEPQPKETLKKQIEDIFREETSKHHIVTGHPYGTIETIKLRVLNEAIEGLVAQLQKRCEGCELINTKSMCVLCGRRLTPKEVLGLFGAEQK